MPLKICLLPDLETQQKLFSPSHMQRLKQLGEVVSNGREEVPTPEYVKELIAGADIAVTSWGCPKLGADILDAAPRLRAVIHAAGTVKPIVTPELWDRGIRVSSGNEQLAIGVAETALGLTIASLKNMWSLVQSTRGGGWYEGRQHVRELYEITAGVIGAGKSGRHYIRLLNQFNVKILLADPYVDAEAARAMGAVKVELDELLAACDVVSIHAPSLPATYKMIHAGRLAMMKKDAILINTARGALIDHEALYNELKRDRLFACLDVTDPEPLAPDHPLRRLPNCVITPHIAGSVTNGLKRLGQFAVDEIERWQAGSKLEGEVHSDQMSVLA